MVGDWLFDGELVGDTLHLFDLISGAQGAVMAHNEFGYRSQALRLFFTKIRPLPPTSNIKIVEQAVGTEAKRALLDKAKADGAEGIMLKWLSRPYTPGRGNDAGIKVKLTKDADLIVMSLAHNGKENTVLGAMHDGEIYEVGRASTIGKGKVSPGDVVEVRYLYIGANGRLVQPRITRVRTDKTAAECGLDQLVAT